MGQVRSHHRGAAELGLRRGDSPASTVTGGLGSTRLCPGRWALLPGPPTPGPPMATGLTVPITCSSCLFHSDIFFCAVESSVFSGRRPCWQLCGFFRDLCLGYDTWALSWFYSYTQGPRQHLSAERLGSPQTTSDSQSQKTFSWLMLCRALGFRAPSASSLLSTSSWASSLHIHQLPLTTTAQQGN